MDRSRRPSSHPPRSPRLDSARGTFREALAALRNLSSLVRSRKVGPRPILELLPDVRAACQPLERASDAVVSAIEGELEGGALAELRAFVGERIATLFVELDAAERGSMNARQRLHLEQSLERLLCEIEGSRSLLSLLESSVFEQTLPIDLLELMLQTYSGPPSGAHVHELISARVRGDGREITTFQPRTLAALIACSVELVAHEREGTPAVTLGRGDSGWSAEVTLEDDGQGYLLTIGGYGLIAPTLPCMEAAARRLSIELEWLPDVPKLRLSGKG